MQPLCEWVQGGKHVCWGFAGVERVQQALVCTLVCVVHIWRGVWAASRIVWILSSLLGLHCAHWQEWVCLAAQHVFSEGVQL